MAGEEIKKFVDEIGAGEPPPDSEGHVQWRAIFRRSNYFIFDGKLMIVKISRSSKPFWGVGKQYIDLLNSLDDYYLILLCSQKEGWAFVKKEIDAHIKSGRWKLREKDSNYKINSPLPDNNSFTSPENFLRKWGVRKLD